MRHIEPAELAVDHAIIQFYLLTYLLTYLFTVDEVNENTAVCINVALSLI